MSARTRNTAVVRWMFVSCVWFKVAHNIFLSAQKQKRVQYFIFTFKNIHHAITYFYFQKHPSSGNFKDNPFLLTVLLDWNENCDVDVAIDRRAIIVKKQQEKKRLRIFFVLGQSHLRVFMDLFIYRLCCQVLTLLQLTATVKRKTPFVWNYRAHQRATFTHVQGAILQNWNFNLHIEHMQKIP